jgi:hypothetical protein
MKRLNTSQSVSYYIPPVEFLITRIILLGFEISVSSKVTVKDYGSPISVK